MKVPVRRIPEICEPHALHHTLEACYEWKLLGVLPVSNSWSLERRQILVGACGQVRGAIAAHVDDLLFVGTDSDTGWQQILQSTIRRFMWGDWERDVFVQCGVKTQQTNDGLQLSLSSYVDEHIEEISQSASSRQDKQSATSEQDKSSVP